MVTDYRSIDRYECVAIKNLRRRYVGGVLQLATASRSMGHYANQGRQEERLFFSFFLLARGTVAYV